MKLYVSLMAIFILYAEEVISYDCEDKPELFPEIIKLGENFIDNCHHRFAGRTYNMVIKPLNEKKSDPPQNGLLENKLTPFWSQELIGADLAREFMDLEFSSVPSTSVVLLDSNIATKDMKLNDKTYVQSGIKKAYEENAGHGALVGNFINGDVVSAGAKANLSFVANFTESGEMNIGTLKFKDKPEYFKNIIDDISEHHKTNNLPSPRLINISQEIPYDNFNVEMERLRKLSRPAPLTVGISHNSYPAKVNEQILKEKENAIIVGSLAPSGFPSDFSQEDSEVFITAPSDVMITGYGMKKNDGSPDWQTFGGTSSAAPLVTGAIANLTSILPDIENSEIRELVKLTAIPTLNKFESPKRNGHGTINALGLVNAAKKIRTKCQRESDKNKCYKNQIPKITNQESLKNFDQLAQKSYPSYDCVKTDKNQNTILNCHQKEKLIKAIRQEALLNPQKKEIWELLSCIYKQEGFEMNSHLYQSIADSIEGKEQFEIFKLQYKNSSDSIKVKLLSVLAKAEPKQPYFDFILENSDEGILKELANTSSFWSDGDGRNAAKVFIKIHKSTNRLGFINGIKNSSRDDKTIESVLKGIYTLIEKENMEEVKAVLSMASAGSNESIKTILFFLNDQTNTNQKDVRQIALQSFLQVLASDKVEVKNEYKIVLENDCDFFSDNKGFVKKLIQKNPKVDLVIPKEKCNLKI